MSVKIDHCRKQDFNASLFDKDLDGSYMSLLAEVGIPANPEIRYGETTKTVTAEGWSKLRYKDNVIDIFIFG